MKLLIAAALLVGFFTLGPPRAELQGNLTNWAQRANDRLAGRPPGHEQDPVELGRRQLRTADAVDLATNVVLFVPLGALAVVARRRVQLRFLVLAGLAAVSGLIELAQGALFVSRHAQLSDWVGNTGGAALGIAVAMLVPLLTNVRFATTAPADD